MMVYLVLLASSTARDKGIDKGGQTRPPEVTFDNGFGTKMPCMPRGGEFMQRANEGVVGCWWYVHLSFKVEVAILKGPVSEGRAREQREPSCTAWITFKMRGLEEEEDLIWCTRERSRAWMTTGSGTMVTSMLSSAVLMRSF